MQSRTRGYLPHVHVPEATYFVTFRLSDSLPASVVVRWRNELELRKRDIPDPKQLKLLEYNYQDKVQRYLDTSCGKCWLRKPEVASIVDRAVRHFDNHRYKLLVWTIMPNHVHVLLQLTGTFRLSSIIHSWKSFSAHQANQLLHRSGEFWQREYFDVLITSQRQLEFVLRYILKNPVKAGLCSEVSQWPWSGCSEELQHLARRFFL